MTIVTLPLFSDPSDQRVFPKTTPTRFGIEIASVRRFFLDHPHRRFYLYAGAAGHVRCLARRGLLTGILGQPCSSPGAFRTGAIGFDRKAVVWLVCDRDWRLEGVRVNPATDNDSNPWLAPGIVAVPQLPRYYWDAQPSPGEEDRMLARFFGGWVRSIGMDDAAAKTQAETEIATIAAQWDSRL